MQGGGASEGKLSPFQMSGPKGKSNYSVDRLSLVINELYGGGVEACSVTLLLSHKTALYRSGTLRQKLRRNVDLEPE